MDGTWGTAATALFRESASREALGLTAWEWSAMLGEVYVEATGRVANLGRCLREAAMLAALESRMMHLIALPTVIRVDPALDRELAARLRSATGVGAVTMAYKRCQYRHGTGAIWIDADGNRHPVARGARCGLEDGHAGRHSPYAPGDGERS